MRDDDGEFVVGVELKQKTLSALACSGFPFNSDQSDT